MARIVVMATYGPDNVGRANAAFQIASAAVDEGHQVAMILELDGTLLVKDPIIQNAQGAHSLEVTLGDTGSPSEGGVKVDSRSDKKEAGELPLSDPHSSVVPKRNDPAPDAVVDINDQVVARTADPPPRLQELRPCPFVGKRDDIIEVGIVTDQVGISLFDGEIQFAVGKPAPKNPDKE